MKGKRHFISYIAKLIFVISALLAACTISPREIGHDLANTRVAFQKQSAAWFLHDSACQDKVNIIKENPSRHCCIVCFAMHPGKAVNHYSFLNHFAFESSQPYLEGAMKFLTDVSTELNGEHNWMTEIIWIMGDDGTLEESLVEQFTSTGSLVFAHSVLREMQHLYTLVPNFHFIWKDGFKDEVASIQKAAFQRKERGKCVFWRGSTTGFFSLSDAPSDSETHCDDLPRVQLARAAIGHSWLDIKISQRTQICATSSWIDELNITAPREPEENWVRCQGIVEIDGNVDAWGARWRLESSSVVFMVASNYATYYSKQLRPGFHYVEISPDLSDFVEKTKLITSTDEDDLFYMQSLMRNSAQFAKRLSYSNAIQDVAYMVSVSRHSMTGSKHLQSPSAWRNVTDSF
jgi:hypothetical protein